MPVLGIAPGSFGAMEAAGAGGIFINALLAIGPEADHQIALAAVVNDGAQFGIEVGGVTDLHPPHVEILVMDDLHRALAGSKVAHFDLAHKNVAMEINRVVAVERKLKLAMIEADARGQRVAQVALANLPRGVAGPEELAF